jgi:hypothetical protein
MVLVSRGLLSKNKRIDPEDFGYEIRNGAHKVFLSLLRPGI